MIRSSTRCTRASTHVFWAFSCRASIRAHMSGVSVSETTPEAMMATMIVMANSWKVRPMRPGMKTSGRKTAARESAAQQAQAEKLRLPCGCFGSCLGHPAEAKVLVSKKFDAG